MKRGQQLSAIGCPNIIVDHAGKSMTVVADSSVVPVLV
jgi:hypothetical protein